MDNCFSRLDYCQYLLVSQVNYTLTHFAEHSDNWSHDQINRYLKRERITPRLVWENVASAVDADAYGYILFDDTVLDKRHSFAIDLVRRQYSGNAKQVIKGIGVVTCVYVNPNTDQFWIIDYRIYDPDGDGKSKLDHVQEMLLGIVHHRQLPFHAVLMDSWYAAKQLLLLVESLNKVYYCPLKSNRKVDDSSGEQSYQRVDSLEWRRREETVGKVIKLRGFPKSHKVKLFRVVASTRRTDYIVTNDMTQESTEATQEACSHRWRIEQLHREGKQLTGLESCQCRRARIQRNHIGCALLVWVRLKALATQTSKTVYQLKRELLNDYLVQQLRSPSIQFSPA
ncbi:Transposase, IS4 family protein [Synechococcus sp. PCC 7335]|uniref:IS701 family transposase n=1 Tax=Synechococcus sp. (strain ATCC 29403 / PCC 7335) TaxID=91464 RepID=UPI00017EE835|nr:transposase [Synechococcus sp. PCC 7335]EDX83541.1 Transposase, IS4 family protein [Synechococcus sp. PCC 7335]